MFYRGDKSKRLSLTFQSEKSKLIGGVGPELGAYLVYFHLATEDSSELEPMAIAEAQKQLDKILSLQLISEKYLFAQLVDQQASAAKQEKSSFAKLQLCSLAGYSLLIALALVVVLTDRVATQLAMGMILVLGAVLSAYLVSTLQPQYRDVVKRAEKIEDRLERWNEQVPEKREDSSPTAEQSKGE